MNELAVALVPAAVMLAILLPPTIIIFRRMGRSPWWAALLVIPLGVFVVPWIMAMMMPDLRRRPDYEDVFGGTGRHSIKRGGA